MNRVILARLLPVAVALASCSDNSSSSMAAPMIDLAPPSESAPPAPVATITPSATNNVTIKDVARFDEPWAMAFLPGTSYALITEKKGKLKLWREGLRSRDIAGVPAVDYGGQGGFGDVMPAPDYTQSKMIYLSWVEAGQRGKRGAVVGKARLLLGKEMRLDGLKVIWRQSPKTTGRGHYSHRIAFSPDGQYLFVSSGERQLFTPAQDLDVNLGKVVRLTLDGKPAPGNPFASRGGVGAEIWSYGHRNLLGLQFDAQGRLWDLEHGPAGGDELNLVKPGQNYGWPIVSDGDHYDGRPIPRHSTRPDLAAPAISWNPVIAPGDFIFYSGKVFTGWKGQVIATGLGSGGLVRIQITGETAREVARIDLGNRIREVKEGPDGAIWVLEDGGNARLRKLTPR